MRLKRKLESGLVRGIYLQMGTDLKQLQEGLDFLKEVSGNQQGSSINMLGSIFLPTKRCDYICCPTTNLSVLCTWLYHINGPIPRMPPKRILAYAPLGIAALWSSQLEELQNDHIVQAAGPDAVPPMEWSLPQQGVPEQRRHGEEHYIKDTGGLFTARCHSSS
jgi:hypothetical protein